MTKKLFPFCLPLITIGYWLLAIGSARAADAYILENQLIGGQTSVSGPAEYIRIFFIFGLGLIGLVALFAVVFGGIKYSLSGSSETGKTEGKRWIFGALAGIVLLFSSYLILKTINPDLVSLKEPTMPIITIEPPPEPTPQQLALGNKTGVLPGKVTFDNPKYPNMEQRFNERAPNDLRQVVNNLPFPVTIVSYDEGQHVTNSMHYLGRAIDIYIGNMTDGQLQTLLQYLQNSGSAYQIICGRMPQYNTLNGSPFPYNQATNNNHLRHIHFASFGR